MRTTIMNSTVNAIGKKLRFSYIIPLSFHDPHNFFANATRYNIWSVVVYGYRKISEKEFGSVEVR